LTSLLELLFCLSNAFLKVGEGFFREMLIYWLLGRRHGPAMR